MPWPLHEAITHGMSVLSWFESYVEEEIPPESIWDDAEGVTEWFKMIKKRNEDRINSGGSTSSDDTDGDKSDMIGNDLADYFRE